MPTLNQRLAIALLAPVLLGLPGCAGRTAGVESAPSADHQSASVTDLSSDNAELVGAFNRASENVQLVLLLSPT